MATWQVQEAKTRFSEVIERARTEGPQTITRHGAERAVVLTLVTRNTRDFAATGVMLVDPWRGG